MKYVMAVSYRGGLPVISMHKLSELLVNFDIKKTSVEMGCCGHCLGCSTIGPTSHIMSDKDIGFGLGLELADLWDVGFVKLGTFPCVN